MTTDHPAVELGLVDMLLARNGSSTIIVATDGEPMKVVVVEVAELPAAIEWQHYVERGGVGLRADEGKYSFYSIEIERIEDAITGAVIFNRQSTSQRS